MAAHLVYGGDDEFTLVGGAGALFHDRKAALLLYKRQLLTISPFVFLSDGLVFRATSAYAKSVAFP